MVAAGKSIDSAQELGNHRNLSGLLIVPPAEIFLEPEVENDKEVAASHFPDLQFRNSVAAVPPGDGDDSK